MLTRVASRTFSLVLRTLARIGATSAILLITACVAAPGGVDDDPSPWPADEDGSSDLPQEEPIPAAQLELVMRSEAFTAAIAALASSGEEAQIEAGVWVTPEAPRGAWEAVFPVIDAATGEPGATAEVVYQELPGEPPFVYFVERATRGAIPSDQPLDGQPQLQRFLGLGCGPWSDWTLLGAPYCYDKPRCIFKHRVGMFQEQYRTKACKYRSYIEYKEVFLGCGC